MWCFCRRAQHFVFPFFCFRPWASHFFFFSIIIARGRKQLIVKKYIFARERKDFLLIFISSPVGEDHFINPN